MMKRMGDGERKWSWWKKERDRDSEEERERWKDSQWWMFTETGTVIRAVYKQACVSDSDSYIAESIKHSMLQL